MSMSHTLCCNRIIMAALTEWYFVKVHGAGSAQRVPEMFRFFASRTYVHLQLFPFRIEVWLRLNVVDEIFFVLLERVDEPHSIQRFKYLHVMGA